jgi:hypothetical protein
MDLQPAWPTLIHKNRAWVEAYEHGWAQLQAVLVDEAWTDGGRLPWAIYCARYLWKHWPIQAALDSLYMKGDAGGASDGQLAWLEWECFRLTGDRARLQRRFPTLWEAWQARNQRTPHGEVDALGWLVQSQALGEISRTLEHPLAGVGSAREVLPDLHSFQEEMRGLPTDSRSISTWLERCLLLLTLLRCNHEVGVYQRLLGVAVDACVAQPKLHRYLPPLLIDGVVGCVPNGGERYLTWWLYAEPPIGIETYALGSACVSLLAKQESGSGATILVETNAAAVLEIVTTERTYLEVLNAGQHELTLTVLDRSDVKTGD